MATVNSTKNSNKPSLIYQEEIENTKKNMAQKMAKIGVEKPETIKTLIPSIVGSRDDVICCAINGEKFYLKRGESYTLPKQLVELLQNTGNI